MVLPDRETRIANLAWLLSAYYGCATAQAGWSPNWRYDAERILDSVVFDEGDADARNND